jgi:catechol 2,3-dioxygenase-like lactoylglutathione lyase family enzyme
MFVKSRSARWMFALGYTVCITGCAAPRQKALMTTHASDHGPLQDAAVMAFAVVKDGATARAFYEGTLGLTVFADDPMALVLDSGGTVIRLQKGASHEPARYTVLGWKVPDIRATAARFLRAGLKLERYDWMTFQDDAGIATFPNGDMVAWFKDPDGNVLSIAQLR